MPSSAMVGGVWLRKKKGINSVNLMPYLHVYYFTMSIMKGFRDQK